MSIKEYTGHPKALAVNQLVAEPRRRFVAIPASDTR